MAADSRFVVDVNVGRPAKWLRVMGYDTLFPPEGGDIQLVRIALQEGRILVTKDAFEPVAGGGSDTAPPGHGSPPAEVAECGSN